MPAPTPEHLRLGRDCLIVLERTLLATAPLEACALLLGRSLEAELQLERIWPCCNCWQPAAERHRRFQLDPREQLLAQRWARAHELQVLGAAHSHPTSAAEPSSTDRELCLGPSLMVIRSGLLHGSAALRAWWLPAAEDPDPNPRELPLHIAPGHLGE